MKICLKHQEKYYSPLIFCKISGMNVDWCCWCDQWYFPNSVKHADQILPEFTHRLECYEAYLAYTKHFENFDSEENPLKGKKAEDLWPNPAQVGIKILKEIPKKYVEDYNNFINEALLRFNITSYFQGLTFLYGYTVSLITKDSGSPNPSKEWHFKVHLHFSTSLLNPLRKDYFGGSRFGLPNTIS